MKKTRETLENLARATKNNENLVHPMIECYKCNATVGEVTGTIREAFGYPYDVFSMIEKPDFLK